MKLSVVLLSAACFASTALAFANANPVAVDVAALERRGELDESTNYLPVAKRRVVNVADLEKRGELDESTNYLPVAKRRVVNVEDLERRNNI